MKHIYLIDDNQGNMRGKYHASFVDDGLYDDILIHIEKLCGNQCYALIQDPICVLLHRSLSDFFDDKFNDNSHRAVITIREDISNDGDKCPLVLFSDGDPSVADYRGGNIIYAIKKSVFYDRLKEFLDHYRLSHGNIDLNLLAYGENYKINIPRSLAKKTLQRLSSCDDDSKLKITDVNNEDFRQFVKLSQPCIKCSYDDIINGLEDNPIAVGDFKNRINKIVRSFNQYGENIYTW